MKVEKYVLSLLVSAVAMLIIVSSYLFHQNKQYASENRRLIIQNDSIISANMELKDFFRKQQPSSLKTSSTSFQEEDQR